MAKKCIMTSGMYYTKFGNSTEVTSRLRSIIIEVDGSDDKSTISQFVSNMLSRDSLFLRGELVKVSPDIDLKSELDIGGEVVTVDIPMTANFFGHTK